MHPSAIPSFSLTTTMVKSNIPNKSSILSVHSSGPQVTSPSVGESSNSLNLISWTSFRAGKYIHPRGYSDVYCTVKCSSRSISTTEDSRKAFSEFSSFSEEEKSEEKISSGPRTSTISRIIADKLFSNRVAPLQLSAAPFPFAPEGRIHSMSWNDQITAEESKDIISRVISASQVPSAINLMPYSSNHGTAESSF